MRYYQEILRACRMTAAIVFTVAVIKVGIPLLLGGTVSGSPLGLLLGLMATAIVCLAVFSAMNILEARLKEKKKDGEKRR